MKVQDVPDPAVQRLTRRLDALRPPNSEERIADFALDSNFGVLAEHAPRVNPLADDRLVPDVCVFRPWCRTSRRASLGVLGLHILGDEWLRDVGSTAENRA